MRRLQTSSNLFNRFSVSCLGDSQTDFAVATGVPSEQVWPGALCKRLNAEGAITRPRGFGRSGDTTSMMLGRADVMFLYDTPSVAVVYGGVNDPGTTATGTATAGAATTITLANTSSNKGNAYVGQVISTTGGTGSGQSKTVIAYNSTTLVATVDSAWSVNPDGTTTYSIAGVTQAQTQANIQAIVKVLRFKACGFADGSGCSVWRPSMLPAGGQPGQRFVVMQDNSTTGGIAATDTSQHATITGDYSSAIAQTVWEWRTPLAGESGWGRVATTATSAFTVGVAKIIVVSTNYLNWSAGGDSYNATAGSGSQYAAYVTVRAAASAAASAEGVVYCNLYNFQSYLIYGGTFAGTTVAVEATQGSASFHYVDADQHHSAYGHDTVARALTLTINAQGWLASLSA